MQPWSLLQAAAVSIILCSRDWPKAKECLEESCLVDCTRDSSYSGLGFVCYMEGDLIGAIDNLNKVHFKSIEYEPCQSMLAVCLLEFSSGGNKVSLFEEKLFCDYEIDKELYDKMAQNEEELLSESIEDEEHGSGYFEYKVGRRSSFTTVVGDNGSSDIASPRKLLNCRGAIQFERSVTPPPRTIRKPRFSSSPDPGNEDEICDMELDD